MNLYNKNGAMRKDENKGMTVEYNILNLPQLVTINNPVVDNGKIYYTYSADGVKRKVKHTWPLKAVLKPDVLGTEEAVRGDEDEREKEEDDETPRGTNPIQMYTINSKTTDYVANKIYINNQLDKILLPNGYIKNGVYFYYVRDHISNNRVVIKDDNSVVQRVDYYANSGVVISGGLNPEEQSYKYNNLEFQTMHGLNWTDMGQRMLDHALARFHVPDRFAEKYYHLSPYSFAAGNAMKYIDVNGDSLNVYQLREYDNNAYNLFMDDLKSKTGLNLTVDDRGNVSIDGKSKDGSRAARKSLTKLIGSEQTVSVGGYDGLTLVTMDGPDPNLILFNPAQIQDIMNNTSSDLNSTTMGFALTFFHELGHTKYGGAGLDPGTGSSIRQNPYETAGRQEILPNRIRRQLGPEYGQRVSYNSYYVGGNTNYFPFSQKTLRQLQNGITPTNKFLRHPH